MNRFRILHFTHTYVPVYGGTTTRLMNLFQGDENDHHFIVPHTGSRYVPVSIIDLEDSNQYDNISVRRVRLTDFLEKKTLFFQQLSQIKNWRNNADELLSAVDNDNFQLIYGHNPMEFALAAETFSQRKNIPLVFESHGLIMDSLYNPAAPFKKFVNQLGNFPIIKIEKRIFNHADALVVQTNSMKDRFIRELGIQEDKIKIIYNGVDPQKFDPEKYRQEAMNWKKERELNDKIIISYFGFLDHNNGIPYFLESLANLSTQIKEKIRILIIGRGPYTSLVETFGRENQNLIFPGMIEHEKMPLYYAVSDLFVIPRPSNNATENLVPMKLFEAMAMEKIVVVSEVKGLTEAITDMKNGVIFKLDDSQELSNKLSDIVHHYHQYSLLGKTARRAVIEKYSWNQARSILAQTFKELLN